MEETFNQEAIKLLTGLTVVNVENDSILFSNGLVIFIDSDTIRELNDVAS